MAAMLPEARPFPMEGLVPPPTEADRPQREALAEGRLLFQVCGACGRWRGLVAPVCPFCRSDAWSWRQARGNGKVVSWVRYHRTYLKEFEGLLPYAVLCVELDEGFRIFGRMAAAIEPDMGMRVAAVVEAWADGHAIAFVPAEG
jgi:hypothetical protein